MIHRIIYEDWHLIFPVVALLVAGVVYLVASTRVAGSRASQNELAKVPHDQP